MTNKEVAERLREIAEYGEGPYTRLSQLADEIDPPRPEPGTVVWWRVTADDKWHLGCVVDYGIVPADKVNACWNWDVNGLEWKPARILAPNEMAVQVRPVSMWPIGAKEADLRWHYGDGIMPRCSNVSITRTEAARMEAER